MAKKLPPPQLTLALQGDLDVFSIHDQREALQAQLGKAGTKAAPVLLDLSGIGDVDLSGIQLLLALKYDLEAGGTLLKLAGLKPDWVSRFQPLGLGGLLDQEQA